MTENKKRFEYDKDTCCFLDHNEWGIKGKSIEEIEKLLNALHEENITLKSSNLEYEDTLARMEEEKQRLYEDNIHIKQLVTTAFNNERTELGRSVLKQLLEAI